MTSSLDTFALSFDSIKVDRSSAPTPEALDHAIAVAAPPAEIEIEPSAPAPGAVGEQPGFYLTDDADGRFTIDRDTGIISLKDERLLTLEYGAVHQAHVKVVEISGAFYDMKFRLRLTGRVPQMAGYEENDTLASLASAPIPELMAPVEKILAPEPPPQPWLAFTAASVRTGKAPLYGETAPFGTLFSGPLLPATYEETADLDVTEALPPPAQAIADWALEPA